MKLKLILTLGVIALSIGFIGCTASITTGNNANAKPANTANSSAAANTASNTAANTAAAPATDGQVIKIEEAGIQMTVPKGFKFSKDGEDTVVKSEDEGVDIRFTVPKDGDYDTVVADAAQEIDAYLDNVKVTEKGRKGTQDGMDITSLSGTAKNKGEEVGWELTIIKAPKKSVLVNIYVEKSSVEKESKKVAEFFKSIKKI